MLMSLESLTYRFIYKNQLLKQQECRIQNLKRIVKHSHLNGLSFFYATKNETVINIPKRAKGIFLTMI